MWLEHTSALTQGCLLGRTLLTMMGVIGLGLAGQGPWLATLVFAAAGRACVLVRAPVGAANQRAGRGAGAVVGACFKAAHVRH